MRYTAVMVTLIALVGAVGCAPGPESAGEPFLIPAYAHNDYENDPPLFQALELGFRGVEADYYLEGGKLLVAHDPDDVRPERTLENLYLEPLRRILESRATVQPNLPVFTLNVESKREGMETYLALHDLLAGYADMLTVVRAGVVDPGPIQVILVGWCPDLEYLQRQPVRYVSVQSHFRDLPPDHRRYPAHLLKLVTVKYPDLFSWQGEDDHPHGFERKLAEVAAARDAVPGRILRVFAVPPVNNVHAALLLGGVDLIGTKTLTRTRRILLRSP